MTRVGRVAIKDLATFATSLGATDHVVLEWLRVSVSEVTIASRSTLYSRTSVRRAKLWHAQTVRLVALRLAA